MAWLRIALTDGEQAVVNAKQDAHQQAHIRRKMLVLWLLHCGVTRAKAAEITDLGRATVQRDVAAYRTGGLDGPREGDVVGPVSGLAAHTEAIRQSLTDTPVRTVAEACDRIASLTGVHRRDVLSAAVFASQLAAARDEVLRQGMQDVPEGRYSRTLAKRFTAYGESSFRFVTTPGLEPTNNAAEQALRFLASHSFTGSPPC